MNILYLHQYFKTPQEKGGTRSYDLATSFVKEGHSVVVITATSDEQYKSTNGWHLAYEDGLEIYRIYLPYTNQLSYLQRTLVFVRFLWHSTFKMLRLNVNLVLATSTPLTIGVPALIKKWLDGTPFVFEVRDVWPEAVIAIGAVKNRWLKWSLYFLEKVIYQNASAIVPLSTDMQRSILSRYPQTVAKAQVVIENISEVNRFQEDTETIDFDKMIGFEPKASILYAGTFGKVNGVRKIVEIAAKTLEIERELVFFLIGDGAEKENVTLLAKELGVLRKNLFILDPVSKKDLPRWYNSITIGSSFVIDIPELWANSANKFFDTLAAGRPILINHEGWQAEIIRSFNVGYVIPYEPTGDEIEHFVRYTLDSRSLQEQGSNALGLAKSRYSLENATALYLNVLTNLKDQKCIN